METRYYHMCGSAGKPRMNRLRPLRRGTELELFLQAGLPEILKMYQARLVKGQNFYVPIALDIRQHFPADAKIKVVSREYELGNGDSVKVQKSRFRRATSLDLIISSHNQDVFQIFEELGFREQHFAYNPQSFIPHRNAPAYRN